MKLRPTTKEELNTLLANDLYTFSAKVFMELEGKPFEDNWHIEAIVYQLERCYQGEESSLIINMPPRFLKSILVNISFIIFIIGNNPRAKIMSVSYNQQLGEFFNNQRRTIMESEWFQDLFPSCRLSKKKNSANEINTTLEGSIVVSSPGAISTGRGADFIICDDLNKADDAMSEANRKYVNNWLDTTLLTRFNNQISGRFMLVQQRVHVDDVTGHLLSKGQYWTNQLVLPAWTDIELKIPVGPDKYYTMKENEYLFESRVGELELRKLKDGMGSRNYASQYLQSPVPETGNIIPINSFKRYDVLPLEKPDDFYICSWDTATKTSKHNDYTVGTTWRFTHNSYYLINIIRGRLEYQQIYQHMLDQARYYQARNVLIEDAGNGSQLIKDIQNNTEIAVISITPKGDKKWRMESCTGEIIAGKIVIPEDAIWMDDFLKELAAFPAGKHDDIVDSTSQFINWAREQRTLNRYNDNILQSIEAFNNHINKPQQIPQNIEQVKDMLRNHLKKR
jgi:predicted phage terminase large subunit-like protein